LIFLCTSSLSIADRGKSLSDIKILQLLSVAVLGTRFFNVEKYKELVWIGIIGKEILDIGLESTKIKTLSI